MERIKFIQHKGAEILYLDFSACEIAAIFPLIAQAKTIIASRPPKSLLTLTNVTDTRQNVVYKVGADQQPSILYRFEPAEGLALNGIVYHADGYLIVIGGPKLYKITTGDPAKMTEVELAEPIPGMDGMVFLPDGRLAVVSNSQSKVVALESNDGWNSASVSATASFEGQATTAAVADGDVYVVQPHFNDQEPPVIERVTFR